MANLILTTSEQEVGRNTSLTVGARLLARYSNPTANSATVHLKLEAISQGITYTGTNKAYEITLDNTGTGTVSWSYTPLTANVWITVAEITQSVNFGSTVNVSGSVWTRVYGNAAVTGNTVTLPSQSPNKPTVTATVASDTSIDITYGTSSFNASSGTVSLYGDTTPNFTPDVSNLLETKTTVGNSTFTHSNLTTGDTYYYKVIADNGTQTSASDELTVLLVFIGIPKIYGSVSGDTKKIEKLYGSVNGDTKKILKVYGSVNGQTKRIF